MPFLLKYWKVLLIIGILAGTFFAGVRWEKLNNDSDLLKERNEAISNLEEEAARAYQLGAWLEAERAARQKQEAKFKRDLAKAITDSPVYDNQCIDDHGLRIINEAISNKPSTR